MKSKKRHEKKPSKLQSKKSTSVRTSRSKPVAKTGKSGSNKKAKGKLSSKSKTVLYAADKGRKNNTSAKDTSLRKSKQTKFVEPNFSRKRGQNTVGIKFTAKNINKKIDQLANSKGIEKHLDYFQHKNKPIKGKGSKPPKGVIIIIKGKEGQGELAFKSPLDFVVNKKTVKAFANGVMSKAVDEIFVSSDRKKFIDRKKKKYDASGEPINPDDIKEVVIRYIY